MTTKRSKRASRAATEENKTIAALVDPQIVDAAVRARLKEIAKLGAAATNRKLSAKQRRLNAQKAAKARWAKEQW